jgi:hypothetical protein
VKSWATLSSNSCELRLREKSRLFGGQKLSYFAIGGQLRSLRQHGQPGVGARIEVLAIGPWILDPFPSHAELDHKDLQLPAALRSTEIGEDMVHAIAFVNTGAQPIMGRARLMNKNSHRDSSTKSDPLVGEERKDLMTGEAGSPSQIGQLDQEGQ